MNKRPWEISVLTAIYIAAPLMNLSYSCLVRGYDLTAVPALFVALGPLEKGTLLLYPFLAMAVWSVSRVGWWAFLAMNITILVHNIWVGVSTPGANPLVVAGAEVTNVAIASLLFTKHARSPYFSPRVRWWNSAIRYKIASVLDVPVVVRQGPREWTGSLLDVGPTGCFVEAPLELDMEAPVKLEFACWGLNLHAEGTLVRRAEDPSQIVGYGLRFPRATGEQRRRMGALVRTLKAHRVPVRGAEAETQETVTG